MTEILVAGCSGENVGFKRYVMGGGGDRSWNNRDEEKEVQILQW